MNKKAKVLRAVGYNSKEDLEEIERREVCSELVKLKEDLIKSRTVCRKW